MPRYTVLDMVQDILSDLDSDEVNSINDSVEALQVAQILKSTYFNTIDGKDWPHLYQPFQLTSSGTTARPTHMRLPDNIIDVSWVKYDCKELGETRDRVKNIVFKTPAAFLEILEQRDSTNTTVTEVTDTSGISLNIHNDRAPLYFTSFDNEYVVFDAYDSAVDSTLQTAKTSCYGKVYPTWTMSDTFVPDLPTQSFSYLLNEAKSTASLRLKQMPDQKAEQHSITQKRRQSQAAWRIAGGITMPNYGRGGDRSKNKRSGTLDGAIPSGTLDVFPS